MDKIIELRKELRAIADTERARDLQRFFKTGIGEYGEGDVFLGITVPQLREIAKKYYSLDIKQLRELIESKFHEERMICLFILINKYKATNHKKIIFHFYIKNTKYINNWDLVDLSAPNIVGEHLLSLSSSESGLPRINNVLLKLTKSENIWERRIAVLATFQFIKNNQFDESLKIAKMLLNDKHDLIHKAVGWMLREVGKKDLQTEEKFLKKYYKKMPRTMLRYAIEKFPKDKRMAYLSLCIR